MNTTFTRRKPKDWWKESIAYQIYPRSFMDSNHDGIGDLNGITEKLDYLQDLGIDLIWICPMYRSPNDDNGYDISDYQQIMAEFGTMADFDRLLDEVHTRGMHLVIDLVINHTSDEHPWFLESRASRTNPKRDWYIWREGKNGAEPNNWEGIFKGSAWQYDTATAQYYLHLFTPRQPDLNWENRDMRAALYRMMRWWLDKGVDGFRIDAICHMKKDPLLSDMPNPKGQRYVPSFDRHLNYDGLLEYVDDMCRQVFDHYNIVTIGEMNGIGADQGEAWVGENHNRLNMIFQFEHVRLWQHEQCLPPSVNTLKHIFTHWQDALEGKGWNALYVENHDVSRVVTRWGACREFWRESATAIAAMYFLMKGTPFIYQGQEIGMTNSHFATIEDFDDVSAKNQYADLLSKGVDKTQILQLLNHTARDHNRTPMQWDNSQNAGFSDAPPWLRVNKNYPKINVAAQQQDPLSVLNFYKALIRLRKQEKTLVQGRYQLVLKHHRQLYAYRRDGENDRILIICNLSGEYASWQDDTVMLVGQTLLLSNYSASGDDTGLRPWEARVYRMRT
nr:alpha-glucosidase [Pantoea sp. 201603H]